MAGDFEAASLIARLVADLLAAHGNLDERVENALAQLGTFAGVDRAYVIRVRENGTFDNTHEWVAEGIEPGKDALQGIPVARMNPELRDARRPLYIASVPDLPPEAPHRDHLIAQGIQSMLIAPMIDGDRRIGLVGFDAVQSHRGFDPPEVEVLASFAGLLTTLLLRAEAEERAEAARRDLVETETRLRTTLGAVPDAVVDIDVEGRIVGAHSRAPDILTAPAATLIGAPLDAALPADLADACRRCLAQLGNGPEGGSTLVELADDAAAAPRWIEVTAAAHEPAAGGTTLGSVLVLRDVSAARRRETQRLMLDQVARRTHNLVIVTDANRRITWVNQAFEQRSGYTAEEVVGRNPGDFMQCDETDQAEVQRVRDALDAGSPITAELLNVSRSGERYWVELDIQPVRDDAGNLVGFHSIQTDISDRKASAARMALVAQTATEAHERLVAAVDALPDAFAYYDAEDRLVLCNEHYWKVTPVGTSRADLLGRTFEDIIRTVARNRAEAGDVDDPKAWAEARLATHRDPDGPFLLRLLDGRWMKILEKRTPENGRVTMLVDVTAELSAMQRLEDTLDAAKAGIWEWQFRDGEPLVVDDRIAGMLGYRNAADLGEMSIGRWQEMMHPDDRRAVEEDWDTLRTDGESVSDHIYRVRHRDGHFIWVLSRGRMVASGFKWHGRCRIGVIIDISQSKRLEAELAAERDYLETLMETSMAAITALDADGQIVYCNREAELLFGLTQEEIAARRFDSPEWQVTDLNGDPMPPEDMPFAVVRRTGQPVRDIRHALNWPDGRRQIVSVNAAPVERPDNPIRVVCSVRDVTAETEAESALREAALKARDATEAKSRFLASMSHEIRTPLNGVLGMAELLDLALTDPEHKEMVGVIRESGALLLSVLNDILDMSKIEAGKLDLDLAPFRPETLAQAVEALHGVSARRKGIDLVVWSGTDLERPRLGDVHRIQQVLHNLVGNAVKFTEAGEVSVTLTARAGHPLTIRVKDTGPGMTVAQVERVFDEFEQADGTVARRHGGSGLGLAIVNRLVRMMQGDISIDSTPGKGTEVRVTLPLSEIDDTAEAAPTDVSPETGPQTSPLTGLRALVAEDNATNRLILRAMLDRLGLQVTLVGDGTEAVNAFTPGAFDLLLLDITMPKMGGMEALEVLRKASEEAGLPPPPAVAITANAMAHQIDEYLATGFDAHVPKPVSMTTIETTLERIARDLAERFPEA